MKQLLFAAFALALLPNAAPADDSAAAASAPITDSLAPPQCKKPMAFNTVRKADDDSDFQERLDKYKNCITAYAAAQGELAQKHTEAANAAVADYNAFVKEMNANKQN